MKKAMVYILALTVACSALLTGCGELRGTGSDTSAPEETPQTSAGSETMTPDPKDGVVRDEDGLITEKDSGSATESGKETPRTLEGTAAGKRKLTTGTTGQSAGTTTLR